MIFATLLACLLAQSAPADAPAAAPQPPAAKVTPRAKADETWTLDYRPGPMRLVRDAATGREYLYATYTLSNRTGKDRRIAPRWELLDESGHVALSGQNVPSNVTRDLLKTLNDPQMVETSAMLGEIAQGEENAKVGIVVFAIEPDVRAFSVLVSGLSNGRGTLKDAKSGAAVSARKTLRIDYRVPGERGHFTGEVPMQVPDATSTNPSWIVR
ncbi:MAG: hypothetical protein RIQ40_1314 [Planctomycetota bacterium]|jgi:hypothetical protein